MAVGRWAACVIILLLVIVMTIVITIIMLDQQLLFAPCPRIVPSPELEHRDLFIDDRLHAWYFTNFPGRKTIFFCHGGGYNITQRRDLVEMFHRQRLNLFIFDYSGFGRSRGQASRSWILSDGEVAYRYLIQQVNPADIIIWGECLGSPVATNIARKYPVPMLVLMSAFADLQKAFVHRYNNFASRTVATLAAPFVEVLPVSDWITEVECPLVMVHSVDDEYIPFQSAQDIFNKAPNPCKLLIPIKGSHLSPEITDEQLEQLFRFCGVRGEIDSKMINDRIYPPE